jgi:DNA invertase Pin-like site-specific DNA recombinase
MNNGGLRQNEQGDYPDRRPGGRDRRGSGLLAYYRYSSAGQNCGTIADQEANCQRWAGEAGLKILDSYADEARSAWRHGREGRRGLDALLARAEADGAVGTVLVYDMDRLYRDYATGYADILKLHAIGVKVADTRRGIYDQSSVVGALTTVLALYQSQEYSDKLSERVATAMRRIRDAGGHVGRAPYGYRKIKDKDGLVVLEQVPDQACRVKTIYQMHADGHSVAQIVRHLEQTGGLPGKDRVYDTVVARILANPTYAGYNPPAPNGLLTDGKHKAIVSRSLWARAHKSASYGQVKVRRSAPLSGVLFCADCGEPMIIFATRRGCRVYRCRANAYRKLNCTNRTTYTEQRIWAALKVWIAALLADERVVAALNEPRSDGDAEGRAKLVDELKTRQARLVRAIADGAEAPGVMVEAIRDIDRQLVEAQSPAEPGHDGAAVLARLERALAAGEPPQGIGLALARVDVGRGFVDVTGAGGRARVKV